MVSIAESFNYRIFERKRRMGEALLSHPRACHILSVEQKTTHASKGGAHTTHIYMCVCVCRPGCVFRILVGGGQNCVYIYSIHNIYVCVYIYTWYSPLWCLRSFEAFLPAIFHDCRVKFLLAIGIVNKKPNEKVLFRVRHSFA